MPYFSYELSSFSTVLRYFSDSDQMAQGMGPRFLEGNFCSYRSGWGFVGNGYTAPELLPWSFWSSCYRLVLT